MLAPRKVLLAPAPKKTILFLLRRWRFILVWVFEFHQEGEKPLLWIYKIKPNYSVLFGDVLVSYQTNCGKFPKRWEYQTTWPASWEICMQVKKQQEVRTGRGTTDWFQIGKGVHPGCILSLCLFNIYAEYIMRNARLDEAQAWNQDSQEKYQ